LTEFFRLTASEARRRISAHTLTAEALVKSCLERIAAREPRTHAWAFLDPDEAIRQARKLDRARRPLGALHGIPIGIKDIIDTANMPTQYNSVIYRGHQPNRDADCVARLRKAGAIILGKTETSEFAYTAPAPTRNPHNIGHTPGGSSSGSAAGIADFMVPLALGTQTGGSTIRPASYCGVFAFKPSYRRISVRGVKSVAASYDTLGLFARSIEDLTLLNAVLRAEPIRPPRARPAAGLRIGYCQTPFWNKAERSTRSAMRQTVQTLRKAGIAVRDVDLPSDVVELSAGFNVIQAVEASWALGREYREHKKLLSGAMRRLIERGLAADADIVQHIREIHVRCLFAVDRIFDRYDALLTPAAPGEPGKGNAVGDNEFNRIWTALHLPCLAIPTITGPNGLPVGIQLVGRRNTDNALLSIGETIVRARSDHERNE
jgi:Asp-tRNA(Asn)/Glu-tRNA(Gln) amidotransferase A subunit family amidase